jgi:hypothetical protein
MKNSKTGKLNSSRIKNPNNPVEIWIRTIEKKNLSSPSKIEKRK